MLEALDVPYLAVQGLEFQSLQDWESSSMGLMPVEATMMVAIPELDGATGSMVFGGRSERSAGEKFDMQPAPERIVVWRTVLHGWLLCDTPVASEKWPSCCLTFRQTAARQAPRRTSACSSRSTTRCRRCGPRGTGSTFPIPTPHSATRFSRATLNSLAPRRMCISACPWMTTCGALAR